MENTSPLINSEDTGLYSNVVLGETWFRSEKRSETQLGWDEQFGSLKKTFLKRLDVPWAVYMGVGNINYFDMPHSIVSGKIAKRIKKEGLHVFLCEALTTYKQGIQSTSFYAEYENDQRHLIRAKELDSINNYAERNDIDIVYVYTPNFGVEKLFSDVYPRLKLCCAPAGWIYPATIEVNDTGVRDLHTESIVKHFWNGNWRYASHRHLIASYIAEKHLDKTNLSWLYESSEKLLKKNVWFNLNKLGPYAQDVIAGSYKLNTLAPLSMKIVVPNKLKIEETLHIHTNTNPAYYYQQSFCAIVTETRFAEDTGFLTEKIMNAILNYRPFIMVGPPGNLEYMRRWGFLTFNEWFDESYDTETCHYKRMCKIYQLIDEIATMSVDQLKEMHKDMAYVLIHNYVHILNLQEDLLSENILNNPVFDRIKYAS